MAIRQGDIPVVLFECFSAALMILSAKIIPMLSLASESNRVNSSLSVLLASAQNSTLLGKQHKAHNRDRNQQTYISILYLFMYIGLKPDSFSLRIESVYITNSCIPFHPGQYLVRHF